MLKIKVLGFYIPPPPSYVFHICGPPTRCILYVLTVGNNMRHIQYYRYSIVCLDFVIVRREHCIVAVSVVS